MNQAIIHIALRQRMEEIFSICGLKWITHHHDGLQYITCAKVVCMKNNKEIIGYIVDETREKWRVQLINNEVKCVNKLEFDTASGEYLFVISLENGTYITKYWTV